MKYILFTLLIFFHILPVNSDIESLLKELRTHTDSDIAAYATSISSLLDSLPEERCSTEKIILTTLTSKSPEVLSVRLKAIAQIISQHTSSDLLSIPEANPRWYSHPTYPVQTPEEIREYTKQNSYISVLQPVMWVFAAIIVILYIQSTRMPSYTEEESKARYHKTNVIDKYEALVSAIEARLESKR